MKPTATEATQAAARAAKERLAEMARQQAAHRTLVATAMAELAVKELLQALRRREKRRRT